MNTSGKFKWQIRLAALVIFLLGFTAGALSLNFYHQRKIDAVSSRRERYEQMIERLNLSAEQKTQVDKIFSDARQQLIELRKESEPRFSEVRKQTDEKLKTVLSPEQWERFQQMMNEARSRRSERRRTEN
ncbi:MAG TPA: hypothetical protein VEF04_23430 [Blastocatellia bacterium]|nr:hypothetical protein [Blastocatellia bacterium]